MSKCSKCDVTGYDHVIDIQDQHYDITHPNETPILRSLLCLGCADKMSEKIGVQGVRDFLYGK